MRDVLFQQLLQQARDENILPHLIDKLDISIDGAGDERMLVRVWLGKQQLWERNINVSKWDLAHMDADTFDLRITEAMRANLNIVGQMHHAWLDQHFPRRIKKVTVLYRPRSNTKMVRVEFMNGHVAEGPEQDIRSDIFLARCIMLYDLPPL